MSIRWGKRWVKAREDVVDKVARKRPVKGDLVAHCLEASSVDISADLANFFSLYPTCCFTNTL